ncbi:MAG: hypothetical protein QOG68_447 [Solirubrobacteraceae bacterium]|nr:hypothetical protein [Solirubrobacteraceae bacterium]
MRARALGLVVAVIAVAAVPAQAKPRGLTPFRSCTALLDYARAHGTKAIGTGWVPTPLAIAGPRPGRVPTAKAGPVAPQAAADTGAESGAGTTFSTTNVQEQGVDEPDVVKTDGRYIYAVANGVLHAIDTRGDTPKLVGTLKLDDGYGHELLLHGNRLLVLENAYVNMPTPQTARQSGSGVSSSPDIAYPVGRAVTRLTEVDVSDPSALKVVRDERDDGEYVSARMVGDSVRIVLASRAPNMYAVAEASAPNQPRLVAKRTRAVRRATLGMWRAHQAFHRAGHKVRYRPLTRCDQTRHTARFAGLDTMTILTVDMAKGLPSVDAKSILSDAQIVYGSTNRLYVATQRWLAPQTTDNPQPPDVTTQIHEFDTSQADRTTYAATGEVGGFLLNQFALSEYRGVLRVASTDTPEWWPGKGADPGTGSSVSTFSTDTMGKLGSVGGLGKGERIYAVRFIDDAAYVVTFRQVDPLYVVDLSAPAEPRVTGKLEIEGYSAYLHPLGNGRLLGVGVVVGGDNEPAGTQLSLFDVSDPANPTRLAHVSVGSGSSSTAEYDHHAFLYWPATKLAVLPVQIYGGSSSSSSDPFVGAVGYRIGAASIDEVARISHPHDDYSLWPVQRATVIGDRLFTMSDAGVLSSDLASLAAGPFVAFPDVPSYQGGGGCDGGVPPPGYAMPTCATQKPVR